MKTTVTWIPLSRGNLNCVKFICTLWSVHSRAKVFFLEGSRSTAAASMWAEQAMGSELLAWASATKIETSQGTVKGGATTIRSMMVALTINKVLLPLTKVAKMIERRRVTR